MLVFQESRSRRYEFNQWTRPCAMRVNQVNQFLNREVESGKRQRFALHEVSTTSR